MFVTDEVYEHIVFDDIRHVPLASLPGMRERTLIISVNRQDVQHDGMEDRLRAGPRRAGPRWRVSAHQFVTFSTVSPLQMAHGTCL